jgi:hypothetical protein
MISLNHVATFLLNDLSSCDTKNLALVHRHIFCGPPTAYMSRRVYNRVNFKKIYNLPLLWDFVDTLIIEKPNLHILQESLQNLDIKSLELRWTFPFVKATTHPPLINLNKWSPYLKKLIIREDGLAFHCLPLFSNIRVQLKILDIKNVHSKKNIEGLEELIKCSKQVKICECLSSYITDEKKFEIFKCLFSVQEPHEINHQN